MTAPTDTEKREAVERWARATGRLYDGVVDNTRRLGWHISATPLRVSSLPVHIWHRHGHADGDSSSWLGDDLDTALLACLLLDAGLTVDVGRCPKCEGSTWERRMVRIGGPSIGSLLEDEGWERTCEPYDTGRGAVPWALDLRRPCPACNATGRDAREAVRLLLDAAPTVVEFPTRGGHEKRADYEGDPKAREALTVLADDRQQAGDPLGEWLLLWLLGHTGWQETAIREIDVISKARAKCPTCPGAATGACCTCSSVIPVDERELAPNPYASEIHDDNSLHLMCDRCAYEAAQDV